jgi:hypothetical protein
MRRAVGYLSRDANPKKMYPLVLDLAADGIPVTATCRSWDTPPRLLQMAQSTPVTA